MDWVRFLVSFGSLVGSILGAWNELGLGGSALCINGSRGEGARLGDA